MGVPWVLGVGRSGPQTRVPAPSRRLTDRGQMGRPLLSWAGLDPDPQPVQPGLGVQLESESGPPAPSAPYETLMGFSKTVGAAPHARPGTLQTA